MKSIKKYHLIICAAFFGTVFGLVPTVYPQGEAAVGTIHGDSYLDGFGLDILFDVKDFTPDDQSALSYLDEIAMELAHFEDTYFYSGAVSGVFSSFEACMSQAVGRHLPLVIAEDKIELAKRRLLSSIRDLFPSFTVLYEHNRGFKLYKDDPDKTDGSNDSQQFRSERFRYSMSQPIFRGGALWNTVKAERAQLQATQAEYKKVLSDLSVEVARAYLNLIRAQTVLARKKRMGETLEHVLLSSEEKMEAALISEIEHLNVQSQSSQIEHDIAAAKKDLELSILEFKKVLHLEIGDYVAVKSYDDSFINDLRAKTVAVAQDVEAETERKQEDKIDEMVKLSYQNRPEFTIQKFKFEAAEWMEKVAQGGWLPQVNLVSEFGKKAEAYMARDNSPPWDDEHRIGLEVRWNFGGSTHSYEYDKNRQGTGVEATDTNVAMDGYYDRINRGGISVLDGLEQFERAKETVIARKEALQALETSEKDVVSEVKEAYYNYNRATIQLKSIFKKLDYRRKMVELAKHRSEVNEIQISEYVQAEMDFMQENEKLYQTMTDYFLAKIAFNKAIGIKGYLPLEDF
jgi:outer membrane protein TolC